MTAINLYVVTFTKGGWNSDCTSVTGLEYDNKDRMF